MTDKQYERICEIAADVAEAANRFINEKGVDAGIDMDDLGDGSEAQVFWDKVLDYI